MAFEIFFYEKSHRKPIEDFLDSLSKGAKAKCLKYIELFQERGFTLPRNYLEKVEGSLWALRPEFGGNEYRLYFCQTQKNVFVIIHGTIKNQKKLISAGLEIARNRRDEITKD